MRKKSIVMGLLVVGLVIALLVMFAVPVMTPVDTDIGIASIATTDLAVIDSEVNSVVIESYTMANIPQTVLWATLGVFLSTIIVVCTRRLNILYDFIVFNLRSSGISANSVVMAGGPNKFI